MTKRLVALLSLACLLLPAASSPAQPTPLGLFTDHADIGIVLHPGSVAYDAAKRTYTITGSGENVWATADAFQFVWKKMEGDFTLSADISFLGQAGDPHKKAMLMARQSLDADSVYVDVALHGDGLASLQFRDFQNPDTHEIQSNIPAPKRLRLQKNGYQFSMWLAGADGVFRRAGASTWVPTGGPLYVGLGVCAHDKDAVETAKFSNVALETVTSGLPLQPQATLETIDIASTDRRVTYVVNSRDKEKWGDPMAPNWTPDGASLMFNRDGRMYRVPVAGGKPKLIRSGYPGTHATSFHSISPDGTMLAFSGYSQDSNLIAIYVVPIAGGVPRRVTGQLPATFGGWSPDGKIIVFMGKRHGEFGTYTIPAAGGAETRLATTVAVDLAEYSPDGEYIYFTSGHSGATEIWRMRPDGQQPEQVTQGGSDYVRHVSIRSFFPRVSPDGRLLAFLAAQVPIRDGPIDHLTFELRVMTLADRKTRLLAYLTTSPGQLVSPPSWSPDGSRLAFATHE